MLQRRRRGVGRPLAALAVLHLFELVEIDVGVLVFLLPSEVEGFDVLCGDNVHVVELFDIAEGGVYVDEVLGDIIAFRWLGVKVEVVGEPSVELVIAFEVDLAPRLFSYEVSREGLVLGADEVEGFIEGLPCRFEVEADAVVFSFDVVPPASCVEMARDVAAVEGFNDVSDPVAVLFLVLEFEHQVVESVEFGSLASDTIGAVAVICHIFLI